MNLGMKIFAVLLNGFLGAFIAMFPALAIDWLLMNNKEHLYDPKYLIILGFGLGSGIAIGRIIESKDD